MDACDMSVLDVPGSANPTYAIPEAPEVMAQVVDDQQQTALAVRNANSSNVENVEYLMLHPPADKTFIPPQVEKGEPTLAVVPAGNGKGFHVRLTLSVSSAGSMFAPGLEIDDCGVCVFCLDKPKYGGAGTKRQKCELKQNEANCNMGIPSASQVWANLHLVTEEEMVQVRKIEQMPLPEPLVKAIEKGPVPVVWAYRRKRRARTLPPAFVLMYYCDGRFPLDRSALAASRQRYFKNVRGESLVAVTQKDKIRRPRVQRTAPAGGSRLPTYPHPVQVDDDMSGDLYGEPAPPALMVDPQPQQPSICSWADCRSVPGSSSSGYSTSYCQPMGAQPTQMAQQVPPPQAPPLHYAAMPSYSMAVPQPYQVYQPQPSMAYPPAPSMQPHAYSAPHSMPPPHARGSGHGGGHGSGRRGSGKKRVPGPGEHAQFDKSPPPPSYGSYLDRSSGSYQQHYYPPHMPPPSDGVMDVQAHNSAEQMEAEANSWLTIEPSDSLPPPQHAPIPPPAPNPMDGPSSPAAAKRRKRSHKGPADDHNAGDADQNGNSAAMSNKTLETMLGRLQGQLPAATYEQVINLVRKVQTRQMSLSRSEFLQHFQAICAGAPKPGP